MALTLLPEIEVCFGGNFAKGFRDHKNYDVKKQNFQGEHLESKIQVSPLSNRDTQWNAPEAIIEMAVRNEIKNAVPARKDNPRTADLP